MPNALRAGTLRVSYVEETSTNRALSIMAAAKGVTISALIREANLDYLKKHDAEGAIMAVAKLMADSQSDKAKDRTSDGVDPEAARALSKIMRKFKK